MKVCFVQNENFSSTETRITYNVVQNLKKFGVEVLLNECTKDCDFIVSLNGLSQYRKFNSFKDELNLVIHINSDLKENIIDNLISLFTWDILINSKIDKILLDNDYRSFYTLIHALYTYYTTFLCLDDCLKSNSLNSLEKEEAIGRIGFYGS